MPNDKLSSSNKFTVGNISSVSTNTNIIRRPYTNIPFSPNKKQNKSNSFKNALTSAVSHKKSEEDSEDFSDVLGNELNDDLRLKNRENSRIIKEKFENNSLAASNSDKTSIEAELDNKTIDTETSSADTSDLYKKIELLNSLKRNSNT